MKRIEATIPFAQLDEVKQRLFEVGAAGVTTSEVRRFPRPEPGRQPDRGADRGADSAPKAQVQIVADDEMVHPIVEALMTAARRGGGDEGQILISTLSEVIRIRTGERGLDAL
jgi:nitrogen regulatory protein P-II 1